MDSKSQKFFPATEKAEGIAAVMISPDRHVFAVSERALKPAINIYDLHSFRKRRTLHATSDSQGTAREFISMAFSSDTRYLAAQLGGPEWILHYYAWEKGKLIATICVLPQPAKALEDPQMRFPDRTARTASISGGPYTGGTFSKPPVTAGGSIIQISICPTDGCQIGVLSERFLKIFHYSEGAFQMSQPRMPAFKELRCHAWLQNERIAVGTSDAKILIISNNEFLVELNFGVPAPPPTTLSHHIQHAAPTLPSAPPSVHVIVSIGRGFLVAGVGGAVEVFEKGVDREGYKMMWRLPLPEEGMVVRSMAVSGSEGVDCVVGDE
ncbi:hypothetical protein BC829DRAFT_444764 [Chytridium lagenaria]|nr:hypothetical protein BC829DRAFT_444764 [Chytridium lagenaria]